MQLPPLVGASDAHAYPPRRSFVHRIEEVTSISPRARIGRAGKNSSGLQELSPTALQRRAASPGSDAGGACDVSPPSDRNEHGNHSGQRDGTTRRDSRTGGPRPRSLGAGHGVAKVSPMGVRVVVTDAITAPSLSREQSPSPIPLRPRVHPDVSAAYSFSHMLGAGAFGTVWLARQRSSGLPAAIKIVERTSKTDGDYRLEPSEAEILKTVRTPSPRLETMLTLRRRRQTPERPRSLTPRFLCCSGLSSREHRQAARLLCVCVGRVHLLGDGAGRRRKPPVAPRRVRRLL